MFLSIWGPKMAPRPKGILIIFGNFLNIFRNFSLSRLFQRFWLISHAQDDQEQPKSMENSMEKDDQNPSQGLPKGSKSPLYGRAVAPALPAQLTYFPPGAGNREVELCKEEPCSSCPSFPASFFLLTLFFWPRACPVSSFFARCFNLR